MAASLINIRNHHIRVFVKNLIRFADYKKSNFYVIFYLFCSINYFVYRWEDYGKLILPTQHCFRIHQTGKSDYQACEEIQKW